MLSTPRSGFAVRPAALSLFAVVIFGACFVTACGDDGGSTSDGGDSNVVDADAGDDQGSDAGADGAGDGGSDQGSDQDADVPADQGDLLTACQTGDTTTISPGGETQLAFGERSPRYAVTVPAGSVASEQSLGLRCVEADIVAGDSDVITLSEPIEVDFTGRLGRWATVEVPFDRDAVPEGALLRDIRLLLRPRGSDGVLSPPGVDMQENITLGFVRFEVRDAGTYQLVIPETAGDTYQREWQFRAITGVSMGCSGALMLGLRNPDQFDIIGALGGPTDWTYLTHYINIGGFGGFAPAPEYGSAPPFTPVEEYEHAMVLDDWYSPTGEGSGGTFDRAEYLSILKDMALAFGNTAMYNDESPYLPPGVDTSEVARTIAERCPGSNETVLTIESGFYDDEYNPNGDQPVIMFCDGISNRLLGCDVAPEGADCDPDIEFDRYCYVNSNDDVPDGPNRGYYPGPESQNRPVVIAWAVDLDGDGQRDRGEPVIRNFFEPFDDLGADGLANADEPGFDALDNPDPNGDDYDWFLNPLGTEGNWVYDEGEPFDDFGLDGVDGTDQLSEGGYDYGEGNEVFDSNPHLQALLEERDPHNTVRDLTAEDWDSLTLYMDAGIRDLFNFAVATNHFAGAVQSTGQNVRVYNGFHALDNLDPELDDYRFNEVDYEDVGRHVYLRYGDPDANEEQICVGDGKHVGPPGQIANRLLTMLGFIESRFPDGDYTELEPPFPTPLGNYVYFSDALDAFEQYSIILPPGHEVTACSDTDDNDDDGLQDGEDPGCEHGMDNDEGPGLGPAYCNDGIDNDRDGLVDAAEDTDCADADDISEYPADNPLRDASFPVVYLLHGYGQTPDDLLAAVAPFAAFMGGGIWQKVIVVYPDGFCGDNDVRQCNDGEDNDEDELIDGDDPDCADSNGRGEDGNSYRLCEDGVDNDGDGNVDEADGGCVSPSWDDESDCVKGNFYTNHAAWPDGSSPGPAFEDAVLDLVEHVDAIYRTRSPESHEALR